MKKLIKAGALLLSAVVAFGSVSGCGKQQKEDENGVVTLKWYLPGVMDGADCQEVLDYANQKLEEKYNMRVDFSFIDGGNFTEKLNAINAAGQEYDLVFTSNWSNDFYKNVTICRNAQHKYCISSLILAVSLAILVHATTDLTFMWLQTGLFYALIFSSIGIEEKLLKIN